MSRDVNAKMGAPGKLPRTLGLSPLVWLLSVGACTSVLGIEDLHDTPRPGTDLTGGDTSTGATLNTSGKSSGGANTNGGKSSGGTGNSSGVGNEGGTGTGNEPSGGMNGNPGGAGAGNDAGAGGAITPVGVAVKGKVIDRWGVALPNVTVQIGAQQVSTDSKGAFTVPNVAATYDLSLIVSKATGWVYQGLTRRDPTLQVFSGQPGQYAYVEVTLSNASVVGNDTISLASGTATGTSEDAGVGIDFPVTLSPPWDGTVTTPGTIHALEWTTNAQTDLPASYKSYASGSLVLDANAAADQMITLNLAPKAIVSKAITGTAPAAGADPRTNSVFMRFTSGATMQVVGENPSAAAFSYIVPQLADATVTVAVMKGTLEGPLGLTHKDGLMPGAAVGALTIPEAPTLLTPPPNASDADEQTSFSFKASPDNAGAFLFVLHQIDSDPPQRLYVVTTQKKLTLPSVVDGAWALAHAATHTADPIQYEWWVETHEAYATVDAMTGPTGFADEFSMNYVTPVAIHPTDGSYTYSALYTFTTKNP